MQQNRLFKETNLVYLILLVSIVVAITYSSRSFVIGYFVAGLFIIKQTESLKAFVVSCGICAITLIILAFLFKSDSSLGRLLIYKISWKILLSHPVTGIGLGNFKKLYLSYQEQYFKSGLYSKKELLLAGNTYYLFNDYFQFLIETGIFGLLLLSTSILAFIKLCTLLLKNSLITTIIGAHLIAFSVAACFTFVFYDHSLGFVFLILLVTSLVPFVYNSSYKVVKYTIAILFMAAVITATSLGFEFERNFLKFQNAQELYSTGFLKDSNVELRHLYPVFNKKPLYMLLYADTFDNLNQVDSAIYVLEKLCTFYPNAKVFEHLGDLYKTTGNFKKAEYYYCKSVNSVPNRISPRVSLVELYEKLGDKAKQKSLEQFILTMPVKVVSPQARIFIERIRYKYQKK